MVRLLCAACEEGGGQEGGGAAGGGYMLCVRREVRCVLCKGVCEVCSIPMRGTGKWERIKCAVRGM